MTGTSVKKTPPKEYYCSYRHGKPTGWKGQERVDFDIPWDVQVDEIVMGAIAAYKGDPDPETWAEVSGSKHIWANVDIKGDRAHPWSRDEWAWLKVRDDLAATKKRGWG